MDNGLDASEKAEANETQCMSVYVRESEKNRGRIKDRGRCLTAAMRWQREWEWRAIEILLLRANRCCNKSLSIRNLRTLAQVENWKNNISSCKRLETKRILKRMCAKHACTVKCTNAMHMQCVFFFRLRAAEKKKESKIKSNCKANAKFS